jgi:hypothetical protein
MLISSAKIGTPGLGWFSEKYFARTREKPGLNRHTVRNATLFFISEIDLLKTMLKFNSFDILFAIKI